MLWVDLTVSVKHAELSAVFNEACDVENCLQLDRLDALIQSSAINGICFDVDYPDHASLSLLRETKINYPGMPILMLTLQHSEALAVWAFRAGVIDYLVKPVSRTELHRSLRILDSATQLQGAQRSRQVIENTPPIPPEVPITCRKNDIKLLPAIYFVQRNFRYKVRSEVVSELCDMSPFRFSRAFHETYGITFQDYLIRYRILEGCRILQNPNMNITDVAYAVGFNDASYFTRMFRRYVGMAPSTYSMKFKNDDDSLGNAEILRAILQLPDALAEAATA